MGRIIASMVARNEAPHYLEPVLERLAGQVDEIVFTDDASTDNTVEIAAKYTDKIQVLETPMFTVHEGKFRQKAWDFLESAVQPTTDDWILAIDADEMLYEDQSNQMRINCSNEQYEVINIWFYHMWNETSFRVDGGWRPHGSTRLFRYDHNGVFNDRVLASGSEPKFVQWKAVYFKDSFLVDSGLKMQHLSYIKDEDKAAKYERYSTLDGGLYHNNSHIESIMDPPEQVSLGEWTWT